MLLRNRNIDPKKKLQLGQICLLFGIFLVGMAAAETSGHLKSLFGFTIPDFLQGFMAGQGGVLLGVSIVLNVIGLRELRAKQETKS